MTAVESRLAIHRCEAAYLVSRDHPDPERLRTDFDLTFARQLTNPLADAWARRANPRDSSIWLIRRVELAFAIETGWDLATVADRWARAIAAAIERTIAKGEDGVDVIRFADESARVAAFVTDLVAGTAWDRWYHQAFLGL